MQSLPWRALDRKVWLGLRFPEATGVREGGTCRNREARSLLIHCSVSNGKSGSKGLKPHTQLLTRAARSSGGGWTSGEARSGNWARLAAPGFVLKVPERLSYPGSEAAATGLRPHAGSWERERGSHIRVLQKPRETPATSLRPLGSEGTTSPFPEQSHGWGEPIRAHCWGPQ